MLLTIFSEKLLHRLFVRFLITTLGNTVKKYPFKRYFPSYVKLFSLYSYHAHFILPQKSQKRVTERNERLNLRSLLISWETQFLISAD